MAEAGGVRSLPVCGGISGTVPRDREDHTLLLVEEGSEGTHTCRPEGEKGGHSLSLPPPPLSSLSDSGRGQERKGPAP